MSRYGRQTPTTSRILPYKKTEGIKAIELYERTGRKAQEWQSLLTYDILSQNDDGLWMHPKFGYEVPRRNGKGEILTIRELYGIHEGEKIMHTAHRTTTSSSASVRLVALLKLLGYKEIQRPKDGVIYEDGYAYSKQFGLEKVTLLSTGGYVSFRTRTSSGGLGEGFDTLVVDEAQEYTQEQQSSLQYIVSDSSNPQIILCGTPPTMVSKGTVFMDLRQDVLHGEESAEEVGWAEWSVEHQSDVNDVDLWYECNPAMGYQLNERKIRAEDKKDEIDFNIQRFGLWLSYNQKSIISESEWKDLAVETLPRFKGGLYVGIKYAPTSGNVAMSVAVRTTDDKIFVEAIDCRSIREGDSWMLNFLKNPSIQEVVVDGNGQVLLQEQMKLMKMKKPLLPTVAEYILANSKFEQSLNAMNICHKDQPSLTQVVTNCDKRTIGTHGGFGYRAIEQDHEIALMESMILAHWSCSKGKRKKKQKVGY